MINTLKKELNISILSSIVYIILGIIMLVYPEATLSAVGYTIAVLSIAFGITTIIINISNIFAENSLLFGILSVITGLILLLYPGSFNILVSLAIGMWYISSSVLRIKMSAYLKDVSGVHSGLILTGAILTLILGIMFIFTPLSSAVVLTTAGGIMMIAYSIIDICEVIEVKRHLKDIEKAMGESK